MSFIKYKVPSDDRGYGHLLFVEAGFVVDTEMGVAAVPSSVEVAETVPIVVAETEMVAVAAVVAVARAGRREAVKRQLRRRHVQRVPDDHCGYDARYKEQPGLPRARRLQYPGY